jgi:ribonuclease HI
MVKIVQINLGKRQNAGMGLIELTKNEGYEIALIQEPPCYKKKICNMNSNGTTYENSIGEEQPRACIWVSKDLERKTEVLMLSEYSGKDCVAIKMKTENNNRELVICSAYFPGGNENRRNVINQKLEQLIQKCQNEHTEIIVGCDANAHNSLWGSKKDCTRGILLADYLAENNLYILNEGDTPTWEEQERNSVIDITFATQEIRLKVRNWKVLNRESLSDHNYIGMDLDTEIKDEERFRNKKSTNWNKYKKSLKKLLDRPMGTINCIERLNEEAEFLKECIMKSFYVSCPEKTNKPKYKYKWITEDIIRDKKRLLALHNKARRRNNPLIWDEWKAKRNEYNEKCKKAKSDRWKKEMGELEDIKDVSRLQKLLEKGKTSGNGTLRRLDGTYTNDIRSNNLEQLKTHFPECEEIEDNDEERLVNEGIAENQEEMNRGDEQMSKISRIIEEDKLKWAVDSFLPFKSPGNDGIFPALLQKGMCFIGTRLQILFRESLRLSYIPKCWRESRVVFIPKIGKSNYEVAKSFRPISLMSFVLKILEKLIDRELRSQDLDNSKLDDKQFAYQEGKGTENALHDLITNIERSIKNTRVAIAVFIDIEGAFDNTAFSIIERAARAKGASQIVVDWIKAMLASREVKVGEGDSGIRIKPTRGCPQGGCLSPQLWCLVVDSLIKKLRDKGCLVTAYADDLALVVDGKNAEEACNKMNEMLKVVEEWCLDNQLYVNPAKTSMVRFTRCRKQSKIRMFPVKIFNEEIKLEEYVKYLGIYLDSKLNMQKHVEECVTKSIRSLWAARAMVSRNWGLNPHTTTWLYNQIIMPRITYGSIAWWHRANLTSQAQKLNRIHRQAMLMITGAMKSTPTIGMSAALEMIPINIMIESRARESYERLKINGTWNECADDFGHGKIAEVMNEEEVMQDKCRIEWNFGKEYKTEINSRERWDANYARLEKPITWYSDGSKNDVGAGSGIYSKELLVNKSTRLSDHSTVMQAEITAIRLCAEESIQWDLRDEDIYIFSDSQAAIMALGNSRIYSVAVRNCIQKLNELGKCNKLTIAWVPGHEGIEGNEIADELARIGTNKENVDISTPEPWTERGGKIKERRIKMFRDLWNNSRGLNHSKMMMEPFKKGKNQLSRINRRDLRVLIGILTGHGCLRKYLKRIGKAEDDNCRYCEEEEKEDMKHLMTRCSKFMELRRQLFGSGFPEENSFKDIKHSTLLKFAKKTGIYDTFFRESH